MNTTTAAASSAVGESSQIPATERRSGIQWRNAASPLSLIGFGLAGAAYFGLSNPHEPGLLPPCLILTVSGFDCPLCGGSRAFHDLTRGNLSEAVNHNVLVVALVPIVAVIVLLWTWRLARPQATEIAAEPSALRSRLATFLSAKSMILLGVLMLLVFAVVRNLPAFEVLGSNLG
jgi:hypothetical protein